MSPDVERTSRNWAFRRSWAFPADMARVLGSFLTREARPVVHVFSGASNIGDVHVDIETDHHAHAVDAEDVRADGFNLPFRDGSVATLVGSPPWDLPYPLRARSLREMVRCLQVGGRLYLHAPWVPRTGGLEVLEVWVIYPRWGLLANANLWTVSQRLPLPSAR